MIRCKKCDTMREINEFYKNQRKTTQYCKYCQRAYMAAMRIRNSAIVVHLSLFKPTLADMSAVQQAEDRAIEAAQRGENVTYQIWELLDETYKAMNPYDINKTVKI